MTPMPCPMLLASAIVPAQSHHVPPRLRKLSNFKTPHAIHPRYTFHNVGWVMGQAAVGTVNRIPSCRPHRTACAPVGGIVLGTAWPCLSQQIVINNTTLYLKYIFVLRDGANDSKIWKGQWKGCGPITAIS